MNQGLPENYLQKRMDFATSVLDKITGKIDYSQYVLLTDYGSL